MKKAIFLALVILLGFSWEEVSAEWSQHAHDAQHTSYTDEVVPPPWRWKWSWNGPNATGGIRTDKINYPGSTNWSTPGLPRNIQPITGGGRVYIAAGKKGIYALDEEDRNADSFADIVWNVNPVGSGGGFNSTPAYDSDSGSLYAVGTNGVVYKFNSATGAVIGQFTTNQSFTLYQSSAFNYGSIASLPPPPALLADRILVSVGPKVFAINKTTMQLIWEYNAQAQVYTPPAYSQSRNLVVVATQDLTAGTDGKKHINVHAINNTNGQLVWKTSITNLTGLQAGDPNPLPNKTSLNQAEIINGWPVIAEQHQLVLIKLRLNWDTLWTWNPWPTTNSAIRSNLASQPNQQALIVLSLLNGSQPFIANIGHGGYADGSFIPMGPQPVVRSYQGQESVFTIIRGDNRFDGRWDSHFGEMVLDNSTAQGFEAGHVRWIQYGNYGWQPNSNLDTPPTDEQPNVTMAGNYLFGAHWGVGNAMEIIDRTSSGIGTYTNPIKTKALPHIVVSTDIVPFSSTHYSANNFALTGGGEWRAVPPGFYIYWGDYNPHIIDLYWSEYATWVVSKNKVYFLSNDGALVALESTNPNLPTSTPTPTPSPVCRADVNKNGRVEIGDISGILFYWGQSCTGSGSVCQADVNTNGKVEIGDIAGVLFYWGGICSW